MRKELSTKEKTITAKLDTKELEFLTELVGLVDSDDSDRQQWKLKMITASNQRLGVKRISNYPYEGAPDIPLPETDKLIKKGTPNLVLSGWAPKNMCTVNVAAGVEITEELKEKAKRAQLAMNMVLRNKMDLYNKFELAADYAKEKGFCLFKVVEEFSSRMVHKCLELDEFDPGQLEQLRLLDNQELKDFVYQRYSQLDPEDEEDKATCDSIVEQFRAGNDTIEFDYEEISSLPNIFTPDPVRVIVPSYTTGIEYANRITEEFYLSKRELQERIDQGMYLKKDLKTLDFENKEGSTDDIIDRERRINVGLSDSSQSSDLYRIRETLCWYQEDEDGPYTKYVWTWLADMGNMQEALLRRIPFPYEFAEWNLNRFDNETKGDNHYESRGVPEQIRAIQEVMERSINNQIIRDEYNNNPIYEVLDTSEILDSDSAWAPGTKVPVSAIGSEIGQINKPAVDVSSERILGLMKAYAEEYLGSTDQLFRNATNSGGAKTLGEVKEGVRQTSGGQNTEVIRWNETLSKVYRQVFSILRERTGDDMWVDGTKITKEDFNFQADVRANGSLEIADKELATQKALVRLQTAMQMIPAGVANIEDLYNSYKDWLEKDGVKDPDMFSTSPQEIMQGQLAQLQQQVQQLTQQASVMVQALNKGEQDLAKTQEKTKTALNEFKGKMEANNERNQGQ